MGSSVFVVITSIAHPNEAMRQLADGSSRLGWRFVVVGDSKSPAHFHLDGCRFYDLRAQLDSELKFAKVCPTGHYARKNIGYLLAMREDAPVVVETDDDNFPREEFWRPRQRRVNAAVVRGRGWVNVYRYFSEAKMWPRGFPLDGVSAPEPPYEELSVNDMECPIQQGLADENPDVDAIYRLLLPLPQRFRTDRKVALGEGSWCPFNSQNTAWFPEAYPLMYLPSYCSFRMTDIWRSFVAQRIAWSNGWAVLFEGPTVWQERNEHQLMRDFADEVPGYLNNRRICRELDRLELEPGREHIGENLRRCYRHLVEMGVVDSQEIALLEAWLGDVDDIRRARNGAGRRHTF